ncbi:MAG: oligosaccharide flippase family protein [Thermodesulfobacteriota bacterium]
MADKEQQVKNSFIYLIPVIISSLIPLLTLPVFTRILTKEDFGVFALAQIYAVFMSGLANFGLIVSYERNFFQYRDQKKASELLYSTLIFVITAFSVFVFLTYLFKSHISSLIIGTSQHSSLLFWAFCAVGFASFKTYYLTYFKNIENAKSFTRYTIYESLIGAFSSLFLVAYLRIGVIGLVWGQLLASFIIFIILTTNFLKILPFSFNWLILKESLKLSYPLTPRVFIGVIGQQFDKYMIGLLATIGGVGIYSIGQRISYMVFTYMTAIQNVYAPQVYRRMFDKAEKGGESIGVYLTPFAFLSIAAALMISLFSEEIISILTPKSYHGAIDIVIILSMFYGSMFFGKQPQLIFAKKTHITLLLSIVAIALNIGLNIPFIMKWGVIGAAWATLMAGLISGAISLVVSQHYYKIKWEYRKIGLIYLIFFASSILMVILRNLDVVYAIRLMVKCISITLYIYLGTKIKVVTMENYVLIKNMIPLRKIAFFH